MTEVPKYTGSPGPDCAHCIFLGSYRNSDLYLCQNIEGHRESVVVRESSRPSDYASQPAYLTAISALGNSELTEPGLLEAWKRASVRGLFLNDRSKGVGLRVCEYCQAIVTPEFRGAWRSRRTLPHCAQEFDSRRQAEMLRKNPSRIETLAEKYALTGDLSHAYDLAEEYARTHELRPKGRIRDMEVAQFDLKKTGLPSGRDGDLLHSILVNWMSEAATFIHQDPEIGEWIFYIERTLDDDPIENILETMPSEISEVFNKHLLPIFREAQSQSYSFLCLSGW